MPDRVRVLHRHARIALGALGLVFLGLAFSFEELWRAQIESWRDGARLFSDISASPLAWAIAAAWLAAWLGLWADSLRFKDAPRIFLGAMPLFVAGGVALTRFGHPGAAMLLLNAFLLALGVGMLMAGVRAQSLARVNGGMLVLASVILCRFFDSDLGFAARGVAFVVLGAGFLAVNLVLMRKKGAAKS